MIIRHFVVILLMLCCEGLFAQTDSLRAKQPPYNRKEEIIHDAKRYRIHNNYLTFGGGFANSTIRNQSQKVVGADFQFHVKRQHFQAGVLMSGEQFLSNNHVQGHIGYGYRRETKFSNLAVFGGPAYFYGVEGEVGTPERFYDGFGAYVAVQGITKFAYDIGLGIELFSEFSYKQSLFGFKIIAFFSGAYKGPKRNYNPNVRSENPNG
jgi:hypothetical protein